MGKARKEARAVANAVLNSGPAPSSNAGIHHANRALTHGEFTAQWLQRGPPRPPPGMFMYHGPPPHMMHMPPPHLMPPGFFPPPGFMPEQLDELLTTLKLAGIRVVDKDDASGQVTLASLSGVPVRRPDPSPPEITKKSKLLKPCFRRLTDAVYLNNLLQN